MLYEEGTHRSRVFICYAHETPDHKAMVLELAELLGRHGIDVVLDQLAAGERRDWDLWMRQAIISDSRYVIVIASGTVRSLADFGVPRGFRGLRAEMNLLRELYNEAPEEWPKRILPVVLPGRSVSEIPRFLQPHNADHYIVTEFTPTGAESLLRQLGREPSAREAPGSRQAALVLAREPGPASGPATQSRPRELPRDISYFTGREADLGMLARLARSSGIVAIAGKPGVGKSALAVHAAHALRGRYPDGQVFVDLQGLSSRPLPAREAMLHVIRAFGSDDRPPDGDGTLARYRSVLAGKRAILILDDAQDEAQVRPLLPPGKKSLVLVTSRRALAGLTEAPPTILLDTLSEQAALTVLSAVTGDQRIRAEADAARTVVRQCGALPLALRIVAARLRRHPHWTVASLAARLEDERRRLDELHVADMEVRACIALSYIHLAPADARSFRRLAVIPGRDFALEVAAAALGLEPGSALRALEELADAQLAEQVTAVRFRFHSLIRIYADERLREEEAPERRDALLRKVLTAYADHLDLATRAINVAPVIGGHAAALPAGRQGTSQQVTGLPDGDRDTAPFHWLHAEGENLMAALQVSRHTDPATSWRLARSLIVSSEGTSPVTELRTIMQIAQEAAASLGDPDSAMTACYLRGRVERLSGRLPDAARSLQKSARYFSDAGKAAEASEILLNLGRVQRERGNLDEAADTLGTALGMRLSIQDRPGAARMLHEIAMLIKEYGQLEDAAAVLRSAIQLIMTTDDGAGSKSWTAWAHENLGAILKRLGRTQEAIANHKASLLAFTEMGNLRGQAHATSNLGDLALSSHDTRSAVELYERSRQAFCQLRDRRGEAQALGRLALALLRGHQVVKGTGVLIRCLIVTCRAGYLKKAVHQFRQSQSSNSQPHTARAINPALARLTAITADADLSNG